MLIVWNGTSLPAISGLSVVESKKTLSFQRTKFEELSGSDLHLYYDERRNVLEFGVSLMGTVGLYFSVRDGQFYLADSLEQLLQEFRVRKIPLVISRAAINELLIFRSRFGEKTLIKGVRSASGGHLYSVDPALRISKEDKGALRFDMVYYQASDEDLAEECDRILADIIDDVAIEDPSLIATALTGGVDSSYLAAHLERRFGKGLFTFSNRYTESGPSYDETVYAQTASSALGTEHHMYEVTRQAYLRNFPGVTRSAEYPLDMSHMVSNTLVQRQLPTEKRFIFSGYGADVCFGIGISKYYLAMKLSPWRFLAGPLLRLMGWFSPPHVRHYARTIPGFWGKVESVDASLANIRKHQAPVDYRIVRELFSEEDLEEVWAERIEFITASNPRSMVDVIYAANLCGEQGSVTKQNMLALSTGREMYFPYFDPRLTAFTKDIDPRQKFRRWGLTAKHILKRAALRRLPEFITTRPKQAGELPVKKWLHQGDFDHFLQEYRHDDLGIDLARLKQAAWEPGRYNYFLLWSYVNLAVWKETFLTRFGTVSVE